MSTPTKRTTPRKQPKTPPRSPGPCPYKGQQLLVPGEVFQQQAAFSAVVKGWNGKRTDQLLVKFDDGTQYWFPEADVLQWMGDSDTSARGVQLTPSSPAAAADTTSTPRRTTRQATAAAAAAGSSGRRKQQRATQEEDEFESSDDEDSAATAATADEVFDMPLFQQPPSQPPLSRRQRVRGFDEATSEAVVAAGVLLALLVMAAAVWLARWPAHELESCLDGLRALSADVREKLRARSLV